MSLDHEAAEFLHSLGYLYMRAGQDSRALAFLLLAYRMRPDDAGILRTLSAAFVAAGAGERALDALDRLDTAEGAPTSATTLLRARALWILGRRDEARRCFRTFVDMRKDPS